jgi:hypothetical protein
MPATRKVPGAFGREASDEEMNAWDGRGNAVMTNPQITSRATPPVPTQKLDNPRTRTGMQEWPRYQAPRYLEGKTALITGGDSGLGRAVVVLRARRRKSMPVARRRAKRVRSRPDVRLWRPSGDRFGQWASLSECAAQARDADQRLNRPSLACAG